MGLLLATLWLGLMVGVLAVLYKLGLERERARRLLLRRLRESGRLDDPRKAEERLRGVLGQSPSFLFPLGEAYALRRLAESALDQHDEHGGGHEDLAAAKGLYESVLRTYASLWVKALSGGRGRREIARIHAGLACVAERLGDRPMALKEAAEAKRLLDPKDEEGRRHIRTMDELIARDSCRQESQAESGT